MTSGGRAAAMCRHLLAITRAHIVRSQVCPALPPTTGREEGGREREGERMDGWMSITVAWIASVKLGMRGKNYMVCSRSGEPHGLGGKGEEEREHGINDQITR